MKILIFMKLYFVLAIVNGFKIPIKFGINNELSSLRMEAITNILKKVLPNDQAWNELMQKRIRNEKKKRYRLNSMFDFENLNEKRGHIW